MQTETLYNLSSSKNITESLKNFGGGDSDTSFVVAAFGADLEVARGVIRQVYLLLPVVAGFGFHCGFQGDME